MKIKIPGLKPRNPYAAAASKRHAGAHDKSEKTRRRNAKQTLNKVLKQGRDDFPPFFMADWDGKVFNEIYKPLEFLSGR